MAARLEFRMDAVAALLGVSLTMSVADPRWSGDAGRSGVGPEPAPCPPRGRPSSR